jgi:hypothetical protein
MGLGLGWDSGKLGKDSKKFRKKLNNKCFEKGFSSGFNAALEAHPRGAQQG